MIYALMVLAAVLAAATVWFLVRPLARGTHTEAREQYYQLIGVRDRLLAQLNELELDIGDRSMEADVAADERARVEGELAAVLEKLDALAPGTARVTQEHGRSARMWRGAVAALAVIVPTVAGGVYMLNVTVAPTQLDAVAALPPGVPPEALKMVGRLEKRLKENPADLEGWLRLGRSYVVLGRLEDARIAYERAYVLLPPKFEPDSAEAYWFLGLAAHNQGDTARALSLWQTLLDAMPPESESATQLRQVMEQAKNKAKKK
jgi:cytochrome c-type biogenesis protein CcmH